MADLERKKLTALTDGATLQLAFGDLVVLVDISDLTAGATGTTKKVPFGTLAQVPENEQTGTSYALVAADAGAQVAMNNAAPNTVELPPAADTPFPTGQVGYVKMKGTGQTSFIAGSGVTINYPASKGLKIVEQHEVIRWRYDGSDTYTLTGELEA